MTRSRIITALGSAVVAVALIAVVSGAFTADERKVIRELRTRIIALEQTDIAQDERIDDAAPVLVSHATQLEQLWDATSALDLRVDALEETIPPFTFSNITAVPSATCTASSCYVDISWNVEPCATGQVEYGLTTDYGQMSTYEPDLLCFHRQRISGLAPGTSYNYRVIATDGTEGGPVGYHVITA